MSQIVSVGSAANAVIGRRFNSPQRGQKVTALRPELERLAGRPDYLQLEGFELKPDPLSEVEEAGVSRL